MVTFTVQEGNELIIGHSGLALIGALLNQTRLKDRLNAVHISSLQEPEISHSDMIYSMIGLICMGNPHYEAIEAFRGDSFFIQSLNLDHCPSSPSLRQRIDIFKNEYDDIIKEESAELIRSVAPCITPVQTSCGSFTPLDIDVSPFDNSKTKKEGVSRTYKGVDGYSPIFSYLGQEGYLVNIELREGSQHCQKNTPQFLSSSIDYAKKITEGNILVRMDSGNDAAETIATCQSHHVDFIIKRNLRKEDPNAWLKFAIEKGEFVAHCREGKEVYIGKTETDLKGEPLSVPIVFEVTLRTSKKGQMLITPEIAVDTYWSTLNIAPYETILLYHDHGTSEQFHSELKSDMDLERLPSGNFSSNSFILLLGMLGYNLLRLCGQESLREDNGNVHLIPSYRKDEVHRRRIRTVIMDLIYMAGRIIHRSRRWFISFGKWNPFTALWNAIYRRFAFASD